MSDSGYLRLDKIAAGGMATVYRGQRTGAGGFSRVVAIKVPHDWVVDDPVMMDSLRREAFVASRLHHANVVSVLDVTELDGRMVVIMDFVDGLTLTSLLPLINGANARDIGTALRIILDCCAGLQAAHDYVDEAGQSTPIVHRDVSPQNILVGKDGVARVTDFGIAKIRADGLEPTRSGVVKGKLSYLAPEYLKGGAPAPESDQFSLAVVAWEAFTGKRLFKGTNEGETLMLLLDASVQPPSLHDPALAPFDPVLLRALSRRPKDRYPSMRAFADDLVRAGAGFSRTHRQVGDVVRDATQTEQARSTQPPPARSGRDQLPTIPETASARPTDVLHAGRPAGIGTRTLTATATAASPLEATDTVSLNTTTDRRFALPASPGRRAGLIAGIGVTALGALLGLWRITTPSDDGEVASANALPASAPPPPSPPSARASALASASNSATSSSASAAAAHASSSAPTPSVQAVAPKTSPRHWRPVAKPRPSPRPAGDDLAPPNPYER